MYKIISAYREADEWNKKRILSQILLYDELNKSQQAYFQEAPIFFLPTYKTIPGHKEYDYMNGKRIPSFTDRILFKNFRPEAFIEETYLSEPNTHFSDHKPVLLTGQLTILEFGNQNVFEEDLNN